MIKTTHDITTDTLSALHTELFGSGVSFVHVASAPHLNDRSGRMVFSVLPRSREIMIAMEGEGCLILAQSDNVNMYRFIEAGFPHGPATIATALFEGLAHAARALTLDHTRAAPQLEDKRS